jgi:hypothetical protein
MFRFEIRLLYPWGKVSVIHFTDSCDGKIYFLCQKSNPRRPGSTHVTILKMTPSIAPLAHLPTLLIRVTPFPRGSAKILRCPTDPDISTRFFALGLLIVLMMEAVRTSNTSLYPIFILAAMRTWNLTLTIATNINNDTTNHSITANFT